MLEFQFSNRSWIIVKPGLCDFGTEIKSHFYCVNFFFFLKKRSIKVISPMFSENLHLQAHPDHLSTAEFLIKYVAKTGLQETFYTIPIFFIHCLNLKKIKKIQF